MADTQWLTQAQYDLLANELKERVEVKRVEIARLIDAARQEGDLRENGGYHAARDEQAKNEARIKQLKHLLETAHIGDTPADDGVVEHGMVIEAEVAGRTLKFLLGSREIDVTLPAGSDRKVFCEKSPLGAAIMGAKQGDEVTYTAPNGKELSAKIISATPYLG